LSYSKCKTLVSHSICFHVLSQIDVRFLIALADFDPGSGKLEAGLPALLYVVCESVRFSKIGENKPLLGYFNLTNL
jgi:hypothetical protein